MHLVFLFGPPAVGKMTVGREIVRLTRYRMLHNHATIEPLLEVFDWESPAFGTLKSEFRRRILEEAVGSGLPGLVYTYVWALERPDELATVEQLIEPVVRTGGRVDFVELFADAGTRLGREGTPERLAAKASKRDVAWARGNLIEMDREYVMSTGDSQPLPISGHRHLRIDNTDLSARETAERIVAALGLPGR